MRRALATLAGAALYGFALGSAHSELYAARNVAKFPLLLVVTGASCAVAWWVTARSFGAALDFRAVQRAAWALFHDASLLLASVAPIVFFFARVLHSTDDGRLGAYDSFLGWNVATVGVCGVLAFVRQTSSLFEASRSRARALAIAAAWLALTLGVGGQAAFYMRPFFGFPLTRGNTPPFFLGAEPDVRGATNFFEAVVQAWEQPPLPERWPSSR